MCQILITLLQEDYILDLDKHVVVWMELTLMMRIRMKHFGESFGLFQHKIFTMAINSRT